MHYLLRRGPISFGLLQQEVMPQYLIQTTSVAKLMSSLDRCHQQVSKRYVGALSRSHANTDVGQTNRACCRLL